jgi:hypothetical protein
VEEVRITGQVRRRVEAVAEEVATFARALWLLRVIVSPCPASALEEQGKRPVGAALPPAPAMVEQPP